MNFKLNSRVRRPSAAPCGIAALCFLTFSLSTLWSAPVISAEPDRSMPKGGEPPPVIDDQPIGRTVTAGGYLALSVVAQSATAITQWWKDGKPLTNNTRVTGVTNPVLIINPVTNTDAGAYGAVVTTSGGSLASAIVPVVVNEILVQITPVLTNALMTLYGQPGDVYRVEVNVNFGGWRTNGYATNFTGSAQFLDVNTSGGFRQLRAKFDRLLPVLFPPNPQNLAAGVRAYGVVNQVWRLLGTSDFRHWDNLALVTNLSGWVKFPDPTQPRPAERFYRLVPP